MFNNNIMYIIYTQNSTCRFRPDRSRLKKRYQRMRVCKKNRLPDGCEKKKRYCNCNNIECHPCKSVCLRRRRRLSVGMMYFITTDHHRSSSSSIVSDSCFLHMQTHCVTIEPSSHGRRFPGWKRTRENGKRRREAWYYDARVISISHRSRLGSARLYWFPIRSRKILNEKKMKMKKLCKIVLLHYNCSYIISLAPRRCLRFIFIVCFTYATTVRTALVDVVLVVVTSSSGSNISISSRNNTTYLRAART